ncbi:NitT/TauT family transport system ATP-binding protein [Alkalibaculum bacchi]|uniref:NitT/TauT family transport system ATP-binding protein n=1 Tax=Alkalibaculum bacchi TaxID=645887 RepID=A0A366I5W6_9FIRM|nr:ABC transporter ATP-binding protein [Alkalibaculum bacchi]RBP63862.1 NitT/TauT family transport system ATP-binding protein [Alkalibaculum bacchi]
MPTPAARIKNLRKIFHTRNGETLAIEDFSLHINEGEFIVLVGPSGCGKTTVLSILAGLVQPSSGEIIYCDDHVRMGYMLQDDHLFPWRTILDNIYLGLEIQGRDTIENKERAESLLTTYGLSKFKNHYPNQLSGGMRQRAALIRTLAVNPEILLLDEPFSALDYQTRMAVTDDIGSIIKREAKTAVMVTHDITEAISLADRVVIMTQRPGKIKKIHDIILTGTDGTPSQNRKAPEFMNYYNDIWKELDIHVQ